MFVVESCSFNASENLKCLRQQELIDIKHHSPVLCPKNFGKLEKQLWGRQANDANQTKQSNIFLITA